MFARPNVGSHLLIIGYLIEISIANYTSGLMHIFTKAHCPCSPALLLIACASPPSVPVAPKEALRPIPPASYFLTRWREMLKP